MLMLASGCVTLAKSPEGATFGADYAEATFEMGVGDSVGLGHATTQEYRIGDVEAFEDAVTVKIFTWAAKKPSVLLVKVGEPVTIFGQMDRMFGAPGISASGNNWCTNGSRFTPRANTRYQIVQTGDARVGCVLTITESGTGKIPDDLEPILFPIESESY